VAKKATPFKVECLFSYAPRNVVAISPGPAGAFQHRCNPFTVIGQALVAEGTVLFRDALSMSEPYPNTNVSFNFSPNVRG